MFKVFDDAFLEEVFLALEAGGFHGFYFLVVWPAFFVAVDELEISATCQEGADGYMHEVLFLFFGELPSPGHHSKLIDADQEQNTFHIRKFAKALLQQQFDILPSFFKLFHGGEVRRCLWIGGMVMASAVGF